MQRYRGILCFLAGLAFAGLPTAASADEVNGGDDVQEQMQLMQQRLRRMEDQLRDTNRQLQEAKAALPADAGEKKDCFFCSIDVSGWVAANYFYNFENGDGRDLGGLNAGGIPAYPFTPDSNSFTLDQVWIGMERPVSEDQRAGFRTDFVFGKTGDILNNGIFGEDGFSGSEQDFHLYQAYVQYLAPIGPGVHFKFGKFATVIGSEVAQAPSNLNITRGHVYNLFQPITHTGILATTSFWEGGSTSFGFVNETRSFPAADIDLNNNKAVLWSIGQKFSDQFSGSFNGAYGDSDSGQVADTADGNSETILDFILNWTPNDSFYAYINADYINSENSNAGNSDTEGYGFAIAGRYAITERLGFATRFEWVDLDVNRAAYGARDLEIWGLTGTLDYALAENLKLRGEVRYDKLEGSLDQLFFDSGSSVRGVPRSGQTLSEDDQVVAGVEVIYTF
jgi:hypothetical protein